MGRTSRKTFRWRSRWGLMGLALCGCVTSNHPDNYLDEAGGSSGHQHPSSCASGEHVVDQQCVVCPVGYSSDAGDDPTGEDTQCAPILCRTQFRVHHHQCVPCSPGTWNSAGDDASGPDTNCEPVLCRANLYVRNNDCVPCPTNSWNSAGDDASGADTTCEAILCETGSYVKSNECVPCPPGTWNSAGDDATGPDTHCDAIVCKADFYVKNNECVPCPPGSQNSSDDNASGTDTTCAAILCKPDFYVKNNECVPCPPGSQNSAGDNASGTDTTCAAILCKPDFYVKNNECVPCSPGSQNSAGDNASGTDTDCDAVLCKTDFYVKNNECVPCAANSFNASGDDPSSTDTECSPEPACGMLADLNDASGRLLHLGQNGSIEGVQILGDRILSSDSSSWALWDRNTHRMVAEGSGQKTANLDHTYAQGDYFLTRQSYDRLELRSLSDGQLLASQKVSLSSGTSFGIGSGGGYFWLTDQKGFTAWNPDGSVLVSVAGNYGEAVLFAAPDEVRIGRRQPSTAAVETIDLSTGVSTMGASFEGTFRSWFLDGEHFFANVGTTVRIYDKDISEQAIAALPTLTNLEGSGRHFWVESIPTDHTLRVYSLDSVSTYTSVEFGPSDRTRLVGDQLTIFRYLGASVDQVDLTDPEMAMTSIHVPLMNPLAFAQDANGNWVVGGTGGGVVDSRRPEHPLSCGAVHSLDGAEDGTVAVATSAGNVMLFRVGPSSREYLGSVDVRSHHVDLSTDGSTLLAAGDLSGPNFSSRRSIWTVNVPSREVSRFWSYDSNFSGFSVFDVPMTPDGQHFGVFLCALGSNWSCEFRVFGPQGSDPIFVYPAMYYQQPPTAARLSPDASLAMFASEPGTDDPWVFVYDHETLISEIPGDPVAWIESDRVLLNQPDGSSRVFNLDGQPETAVLPSFYARTQLLPGGEIYDDADGNLGIYSLDTGDLLWPDRGTFYLSPGTVANGQIVRLNDVHLFVEPR